MSEALNETHDTGRRSWVDSANTADADFPIQNLPYGIFRTSSGSPGSVGVAIGDLVLDVAGLYRAGLVKVQQDALAQAVSQPSLNTLMSLEAPVLSQLRKALSGLLDAMAPAGIREQVAALLVPMRDAELLLPAHIGDYSDFLTSAWHTERHGRFKGLQDPLPRAFFSLPVAYHGRASSIRVSGADVVRPRGQFKRADGEIGFGPSEALDFELELGAFVGTGNELGHPVSVDEASRHLFGYCLLNDWSAKDIQWWEQVLGPFLGKSFMTSISPWVVTAEALAPFRAPMDPRPVGVAPVLPHLAGSGDTLDIRMEAWLRTPRMRESGDAGARLSLTNPCHLSWSFEQMLAHHTSNGCNMRSGDLIGSGTISGESASAMGCMTEMTAAGRNPLELPNGETRRWLQDGDEIVFRAKAARPGYVSVGFGECRGVVRPFVEVRPHA